MAADHSSEIVEAFTQIAKEKNIEKDELNLIIEEIFKMMIKKKYGEKENFDVIVNLDKAAIEIYQTKTVVEEVEDPITQISVDSAKKVEPDMEIGDDFIEVIDPATFGRRLIISARQTLNQRIRDIERKLLFDEFSNRVGEIIVGEIRQINRNEIFVSFERAELIMPKAQQIANERYKRGETVRALIKEVVDDPRGPRIVVSRSEPMFLMRLFENEVPEIYDGIIEIKAIARDPGERTKIAVYSNDKRIDAVGACVGMKGVRIQAIVKELNNEKIDIISWSSDPEILISRALSPAKPLRIEVDQTEKKALAVINDDEMSIAVGRFGQNINLASRLTGYQIETIKYSELSGTPESEEEKDDEQETTEAVSVEEVLTEEVATEETKTAKITDTEEEAAVTEETMINDIKGVSKAAAEIFAEKGFVKLGDINDIEELRKAEGVSEKSLNKLISTHSKLQTKE
ncbi:transcription termination factor NusA [bacterium]|nr:MAG: transcription termination factor NusA [bacterium]